jgi:hypothetical protein
MGPKMRMASLFFWLACASGAVSWIQIYRIAVFLGEQGNEIRWLDLRFNALRYSAMYKGATLDRYGTIGSAYYLTYIFFGAGLIFLAAMIVSKMM